MKLNEVHNIDQAMSEGTVYDMDKEYGAPAPKHKPVIARGASSRYDPEAVDPMHPDQRRFQADQDRYLKAQRDAIAKMKAEKGLEETTTDNPEYTDEVGYVKDNLHTIARMCKVLNDTMVRDENLPDWVQEKVANAKGMLVAATDYLESQHEQGRVYTNSEEGMAEGSNVDSQIKRIKDRILQLKDWNTTGSHDKKIKELQTRLKELQSQKQGVAEDDAGDVEQRMRIKIEREKQRLAQLKQSDPAAYQREIAKRNTSSKIPPVSTFEQQGVAESADTHWIPDVVVLLKKLLLSSKAQAKYDIEPQDIPEIKKLIKLLRTGNLDAARELWDLMETYDLDNALEYFVRKNGLPHVQLHKLLGDQGVAEGSLNEFAVSGDSGGDDSLFNYAKMWYNGDLKTQRQVEKALQKAGLDIGENEDENGGAYISDLSGDYYESWTAEDLDQGVAEGMKAQDLSMYCEKLVAENGWKRAYKHALMMANLGRDPAWNGVLKYLDAMKQGAANSMPQGNYSDEAHPIRDDGNEPPDYAAMYESKLVEFAGGMGAGSVATAPGVGKGSNVGSLFGGSYSQKNSPFKAKKPKKSGMIKR